MSPYFYRTVFCRLFATASALLSGVISLKLCSRFFTPEIYGIVLVALQIVNYLPLLDGGFRTAINRQLLAQPDSETQLKLIRFSQTFYARLALVILLVAVVCMAGYAFTPNATQSGQPAHFFLVIGLVGALTMIGGAQQSLLVGLQAQASLFFLTALSAWVTLLGLWISLLGGAGVWAFPISSLAGVGTTLPIALRLIRQQMPEIRFFTWRADAEYQHYFKRLKRDAWSCFRSQVSTLLLYSVDVVLVGMICGPRDTAIYGIVSRIFYIVHNFLQSSGEVAWPIVAQNELGSAAFRHFLLRINAWIYGGIMGAISLTLAPFLAWYLGSAWAPASILMQLLVVRYLITGVINPAAYFLVGLGEFQAIARYLERELAAALILAVGLGMRWAAPGVAGGFVLATSFGTLAPIFYAYAKASNLSLVRLLAQLWWRALLGFAASYTVAATLLSLGGKGMRTLYVGPVAAAAAVCLGVAISCVRLRLAKPPNLLRVRLSDVMNKI